MSEIKMSEGPIVGDWTMPFFQCLVLLAIIGITWLWTHHSSRCLHHQMVFSIFVSVSKLSLILQDIRLLDYGLTLLQYAYMHAKSIQSCPTLCDPVDCSLSGSFVHGILQARTQELVAMPFSRVTSQPRDQTCVFYLSYIGRQILYHRVIRKPSPL